MIRRLRNLDRQTRDRFGPAKGFSGDLTMRQLEDPRVFGRVILLMTETDDSPEPGETIELQQFLKLAQVVASGGEAKLRIRSGDVQVNGTVELRRGRKLRAGDLVEVDGEQYVIESDGQ